MIGGTSKMHYDKIRRVLIPGAVVAGAVAVGIGSADLLKGVKPAGGYSEGPESISRSSTPESKKEIYNKVSYFNDVNMTNMSDSTKKLILAGIVLGVGLIAYKSNHGLKMPKV